ncbi:ATP-dependent DNA helicase [Enterococcus lemanii]|uniref:ATP-dependent DNA helicase n=1 Tax=Enterococcus lemanii TaxID=1159752 RepID=A0ABV9MWT8_9ENTE|nr:ATP-dependent DNA helicase [Enterococcus lemanii]MBM7709638.1 Rad3-related DNA helicase [Enterococcus lemanii]
MQKHKIAVRELVEFILRKGDIDNRKTSNHTAQEGARIHRKLQKEAGEAYQKEVFLKTEYKRAPYLVQLEGRADGVFKQDECWTIDEIKTSEIAFEDLPVEQKEQYFAQGMVYAYLFNQTNCEDRLAVRLTYYQTLTQKIHYETRVFTKETLESFLEDLMNEYHRWLMFQSDWRKVRNLSLMALKFPYEAYRKGQRELAVVAYKALKTQQTLFVEAPTGTGKTISTLFPALKILGEESNDRIFYLTAKTITRTVAEDAMKALSQVGAKTKSVTLTAKDKICFLDERKCNPDDCPYAKGYYNRINETLWDLINHETLMTREVIEAYAQKYQVCPFELSLDVSLFCDLIISDYNYLFDPVVYLKRFFEEEQAKQYFLVDEAHNLVPRSRDMYSASINDQIFVQLKTEIPKGARKIHRKINQILSEFDLLKEQAIKDNWHYKHQKLPPETLVQLLLTLTEQVKEWLAKQQEGLGKQTILTLYFDCIRFLKINEFYDEHYETTIEIGYRQIQIKQFCLDPSLFLADTLNKGQGSLLFSASFSPLDYYQKSLANTQNSYAYRLPSPFPKENLAVLIANDIQTTYQQRKSSIPKIVKAIQKMVFAKKGNYLVFFPSYQYLDAVYEVFKKTFPEVQTLIQGSGMNESEREAFLAHFQNDPEASLVGFCVLGGIFSEGIDLKGSRLIGVAIVGVGLPQINEEQSLLKDYFQGVYQAGFDYAYKLPGMNKVLQAAGRVIRDTSDYGVVLLLDQRFATAQYHSLLPAHWLHRKICNNEAELEINLRRFWQNHP